MVVSLLNTLISGLVVSLDNKIDYYEISLKECRLSKRHKQRVLMLGCPLDTI